MEDSRKRYITSYNIATVYALLGETDEAFHWLQKAIGELDSLENRFEAELRYSSPLDGGIRPSTAILYASGVTRNRFLKCR